MKSWQLLQQAYRSLSAANKKTLGHVFLSYFLVLSGYSALRSVTTALFLQTYGAKDTPLVSFLAVFVLIGAIGILNRLQKATSVQFLFTVTSLFSALLFAFSYEGLKWGIAPCAGVLFVWKEVYIVFLIHMTWGYLNNLLREGAAKYLFGLIAAGGSIGGIVGGLLPSFLTGAFGPRGVILAGVAHLLLGAWLFAKAEHLATEEKVEEATPLATLSGVGPYVFFLAGLVILSQVCIGIVDFLFNLRFQLAIPDVAEKVDQLGYVYAAMNAVGLILKLAVLPILFSITSNRWIQTLVPVTYLALSVMGFGAGAESLLVLGFTFVAIKGIDYSIFSVSKELLYYPLAPRQKFGAKYVVDMFAYRFSKALISFGLIFVQSPALLNGALAAFLGLWIAIVYFGLAREWKLAARLNSPSL